MDTYKDFRDKLKQLDNKTLVDSLDIERELLSEMEKNDPVKFKFEWRIKLYQAELRIRKYFNEAAIKYSPELSIIEITIETYVSLLELKSEFDCKSLNEKIISSLISSDKNEIILCAARGTEIIIDIKTLMSDKEEFSYKNLSYWLDKYINPDYQEMSELRHLFWSYILEESNVFKLFREVGTAFLTFFDKKKIENSRHADAIYNSWSEGDSMQKYISGLIKEKNFIDLHLEIITANSETKEHKWYVFDLNSKEISIRIGDVGDTGFSFDLSEPYFTANIYKDYNLLFGSEKLSLAGIKSAAAQFIHSFSLLLPSTSYRSNIEKEIIHVLDFKFSLSDIKPKSYFDLILGK